MKKTLLAVIVVLGLVSGGYFLLPQGKLNEVVQYLPEPISSFFGSNSNDDNEGKQDVDVEEKVNETTVETVSDSQDEAVNTSESLEIEVVEVADVSAPIEVKKLRINQQENSEVAVIKKPRDTASSEKAVVIASSDSSEVIKIKKRLVKVQNSIKKSDDANINLKARYDKIIKENRTLALELKKINDQIKHTK